MDSLPKQLFRAGLAPNGVWVHGKHGIAETSPDSPYALAGLPYIFTCDEDRPYRFWEPDDRWEDAAYYIERFRLELVPNFTSGWSIRFSDDPRIIEHVEQFVHLPTAICKIVLRIHVAKPTSSVGVQDEREG